MSEDESDTESKKTSSERREQFRLASRRSYLRRKGENVPYEKKGPKQKPDNAITDSTRRWRRWNLREKGVDVPKQKGGPKPKRSRVTRARNKQETISRVAPYIGSNLSVAEIAKKVKRSPTTVSRTLQDLGEARGKGGPGRKRGKK